MSRTLSIDTEAHVGYVNVEVELTPEEIVEGLDDEGRAELLGKLVSKDRSGDHARNDNLIERAYLAAKQLPDVPREISDLFWHVHGRALS